MFRRLEGRSSHFLLWTTLLFLVSVCIRAFLSNYDKLVSVYPDELLYIEACRGMLSGDIFTFRGVDSGFDKILYSLFLLPSMVFGETDTQLRVVSFLNAVYISSSAFPVALLAKRVGLNAWLSLVSVVLVLILPDMCLSMTFMSENIFIPFSLWLVYWTWLTISAEPEKQVIYAALLSVACFLIYLCKEVGLCFVLIYSILLVHRIVVNKKTRKDDARSLITFVLVFVVLFIWFKMFVYHQESHYSIALPQSFLELAGFFVYALAVNLEYMVVSVFVVPVLICLWSYGAMEEKDRYLFLIGILWGLITVLVITYTISIREDITLGAIRQHTRYYSALSIPFFVLFLKYALKKNPSVGKLKSTQFIALIIAILFMLATVLLSPVFYGSLVDNLNLRYLNWFIEIIRQYLMFDAVLVMRITVAVASALFFVGIAVSRYRRFTVSVFLLCVLAVCAIGNTICIKLFESAYSVTEEKKNEVIDIGKYLSKEQANVLVVMDSNPAYSFDNRKLDTFLNIDSKYQVYADTLVGLVEDDGVVDLSRETIATRSFNLANLLFYDDLRSINYVLVNADQGISVSSESGTIIDDFTYGDYRLYELSNTSKIDIEISPPKSDFSLHVG